MDDTEKKIKKIWMRMKSPGRGRKRGSCPDESIFTLYAGGGLTEKEREGIEEHILECESCLSMLAVNGSTGEERGHVHSPDAPSSWRENAKALYTAPDERRRRRVFDIVLQFTRRAVEVVSNPGNMTVDFGLQPAVRSAGRIESPDLIVLNKTFENMESEITIERIDDRHVNMKVRALDSRPESRERALRISLLNPDRELASFVAEKGEVRFGGLNYGEYEIRLIREGKEIGKMTLNITLSVN